MNEWWKDPKFLMIGGVAVFAAFILMRNQGSSSSNPAGSSTNPQLSTLPTSGTTPVGQSYSYLDGTGMQHLTATDPNGNLINYQTMPPDWQNTQSGQLGSYVGMMGNPSFVNPYGGWSPYYSLLPTTGDFAFNQSPTISN